jgi:hypothetical protein
MTNTHHQIADLLAPLTPEQQEVFLTFYAVALAQELADAEAAVANTPLGAVDPDEVELALVERAMARARGERLSDDSPDQVAPLAFVPLPEGRIYRFSQQPTPAPVEGGAPAAAVQLGTGTAPRPRHALALAVIVAGLVLIWFAWPRTTAPAPERAQAAAPRGAAADEPAGDAHVVVAAPPSSPTALVDARARGTATDDPVSLEIDVDAHPVWRVIPSSSELGGQWQPDLQGGTAAWLADSVVNPIICVPPDHAATLADLERGTPILVRLASGTLRRYAVLAVEQVGRQQTEVLDQRQARLTLIACGGSGNERTVVTALYRPDVAGVLPPPEVTHAELPSWVNVSVDDITIETTDATAQVTIAVSLTNRSGQPLELHELSDQLTLDGTVVPALLAGRTNPLAVDETRTLTYRYRVPGTAIGGQAVWQLIAPDGQRVDLLLTLSPDERN